MKPYYQDDSCVIWHGDCREILPGLDPVDLVLTDPPYGVALGIKPRAGKMSRHGNAGYTQTDDTPEFVKSVCVPVIETCRGIAARVMLTPGSANMLLYPKPDAVWCMYWPNGAGIGKWRAFTCWQPLFCYGPCPSYKGCYPDTFVSKDSAVKNGHPCPKPVSSMIAILRRMEPHTILDPFMGSGTTLLAAKQLGRRAIGIEIEERYCEIAAGRLGNMHPAKDDEPLLAMMQAEEPPNPPCKTEEN